ncbi:30S ribosomal protein S6 [candidate division WOR-3 bacterium RBG_13_43_14]|uniref:Small ribosomal subunit protein bS6 n=1 Tax=candidate division WOR-3 bacterium RBG_13_43_14 TaxID=1802590 RepID=A0A1F4UF80_UNCW3|nr:MAG: 30S ribosomal protein S6 [candidate division WOR-3 bacterium RBG_13_43_14]
MRDYEAMFIFSADLTDEILEKEIRSVERAIKTRGKGSIQHENLGKKTLAYPVKKKNEGTYVNYNFTAEPGSITKIKDYLKHKEDILRFMILIRVGKK